MISFRSFSLVISLVLLRQVALQTSSDAVSVSSHADRPFNWLILGCTFFCVVAKFLPVAAMFRADNVDRRIAWREMERYRQWLEWLWMVAQGWLLANTGAAQALAGAEQSGWSPALMIGVWFLPTIIFLSALEFSFTQLECLWSSDGDQSSAAHWSRWITRVRLGALGNVMTCLVPVCFLLTALDITQYTLPGLPELWRAVLALIALGIVGLTFAPLWLRLWSGARALPEDDPLSKRVEAFCEQLRIPTPKVCSIDPRQSWHGLALVGWTPLFRQLWVGSAVSQSLSAEEMDMVLLHELAHLKRGHCWWRIIPLLLVGVSCVAVMSYWPLGANLGWGQLGMSLSFAIGMIWMLGRISKQCELDADRQACYFAAKFCTWADGQPSRAMTALSAALVTLSNPDHEATQTNWLHPSLAKRMAIKP